MLTKPWQDAMMRRTAYLTPILVALCLMSCTEDSVVEPTAVVNNVDPYLARALNDPLMVDTDLAYRNEANAAITIGFDHALPSFKRTEATASAARETARLALLADGPIPDLPFPDGPGPVSLAESFGVEDMLEAVGAPSTCRKEIGGDFKQAASMPEVAPIMPHGMVRVVATVNQSDCILHLVRYVTPASIEDVMQFHYTVASRTGMEPETFNEPEASLIADRRGTYLKVFARETAGKLTAVDLVTWSR